MGLYDKPIYIEEKIDFECLECGLKITVVVEPEAKDRTFKCLECGGTLTKEPK